MLNWGSSTLDITTAGIVGISYCWYGFGYCTVLMLAVLTDGRWKLAATYCNTIRCHHCGMMLKTDQGRSTPCRMPHSSTAHISMTVDSTCLHYLILYRKLQQSVYWRLLSCPVLLKTDNPLSRFTLCSVAEFWCYTNWVKFTATEMLERMQNVLLRISYREIPVECVQQLTGL